MHIQRALRQVYFSVSVILYTSHVLGQDCGSQGPCPNVTLPWGTWQANSYNQTGDFFTFRNIRFGEAPVGSLRFTKSVPPDPISNPATMQNNTYGPACIAVSPGSLRNKTGQQRLNLGEGTLYYQPDPDQSEDCLFLDVYVPRSAFTAQKGNVPVVVWIYGGAFIFGSKNTPATEGLLYSGTGLLQVAQELSSDMIFVVGNYRLGAFGWLAGNYMEAHGTPNAGLTDQRLLLEWVQRYIYLFGGDRTQVSAWGESAGGGSIVHHLVSYGGTRDPLFRKAIVQSAAYYWAWDRTGSGPLNTVYQEFAALAGCLNYDIDCLRKADVKALAEANVNVTAKFAGTGRMPFGPAVDGSMIRRLPAVEFSSGNFWKNMNSLILSRVVHESDGFVPQHIDNETAYNDFLNSIFPGQPSVLAQIEKSPFYTEVPSYQDRLIDVARDAFFTGNILQVLNAYQSIAKVYITQYAWPISEVSKHGYDLIPTFYYIGFPLKKLLETMKIPDWISDLIIPNLEFFSPRYKQYFLSHAIKGDPNLLIYNTPYPWHYEWFPASYNTQNFVEPVAQSSLVHCDSPPICFRNVTDHALDRDRGDFWTEIALQLTPLS